MDPSIPKTDKEVAGYKYNSKSQPIGRGSYGNVYLGYGPDGEQVAIKVISRKTISRDEHVTTMIHREVELLRTLKSRYIAEFKAVSKSKENLYLVTKYCPGGDLSVVLSKSKVLPVERALTVVKQVTQAFLDIEKLELQDAKKNPVLFIHRDIKPENILFSEEGEVRLIDFGFSRTVDDELKGKGLQLTCCGSANYSSPQIIMGTDYNFKCDIFSLGAVMYEMIFGKQFWDGKKEKEYLDKVKTEAYSFDVSIPTEVEDLLKKMLKFEENDRIDWPGIMEHPAIKKYAGDSKGSTEEKSQPLEETKSASNDIKSQETQSTEKIISEKPSTGVNEKTLQEKQQTGETNIQSTSEDPKVEGVSKV